MDGGAKVTNAKCAPLPTECRHGEDAVCHTADSGGGGEDQTSTGIRGGSDQAGSRNEGWCSVVVAEAPLQHCRLVSFFKRKMFCCKMEEQKFEMEKLRRELSEKMAEITRIKATLQSSEMVS